jgi:apolipoprotein N-acyltransferase
MRATLSKASKLLPALVQLLLTLLTLPPVGFSFLVFIAFMPVVVVLMRPDGLRLATLNGFIYGLGLGILVYAGGGLFAAVMVGGLIGISWATSILVVGAIYSHTRQGLYLFLLPLLLTLFESGFELFGWGGFTSSFCATSIPLFAQLASLGGTYLLNFTLYAINIGLLLAFSSQLALSTRRIGGGLGLAFFTMLIVYGAYRLKLPLEPGEDLTVMVVQSLIDMECHDGDGQLLEECSFDDIVSQSRAIVKAVASTAPDLVIMPETDYGFPLGIQNELHQASLPSLPSNISTTWLMYKNSVDSDDPEKKRKYLVSYTAADGILHAQPKVQALPFIEDYVITPPVSSATTHVQAPGNPAGMICYESVLGLVNRHYANQRPGFIAVSSGAIDTDGAKSPFTREVELVQLEISRIRAIESGKFVVRAANAIGSAVIDPRGRFVAVAPHNEFVILTVTVRAQYGLTPYMQIVSWLKD